MNHQVNNSKNVVINSTLNADTIHIGDKLINKPDLKLGIGWFESNLDKSIKNLGERYSELLNFELPIVKIFDGLILSSELKKEFEIKFKLFEDEVKYTIRTLNYFEERGTDLSDFSIRIKKLFTLIVNWFNNIIWEDSLSLKFPKELFDDIYISISDLWLKYREIKVIDGEDLDGPMRELGKVNQFIDDIEDFTYEDKYQLALNPFLFLKGEAGVGKSHLIGDLASNHQKNGGYSILLLGQNFIQGEIWTQILKFLSIPELYTKDELLITLNEIGQNSGKRTIIFIDALNEGEGKKIWQNQLLGFIQDIKKYQWIGLVFSVRSDFIPIVVPKNLIENNEVVEVTHQGFRGFEHLASQTFFNYYELQAPKIPLLNPEFSNPLFLLLFCNGLKKSGYKYIPEGMSGISKIIDFLFQGINYSLSLKYDNTAFTKINLSNKCAIEIANILINKKESYVLYDDASIVLNQVYNKFCIGISNCHILTELISEGLFKENVKYNYESNDYETIIEFNYERFGDYIIANYLFDKHFDSTKPKSLFKEGDNLSFLLKNIWVNIGILRALAVIIPEKSDHELYELVPKKYFDENIIIEAYIKSLAWRKVESVKPKTENYIIVIEDKGLIEEFLDTMILICSRSNHIYNANYLHTILISKTLIERDSNWTIYLNDKYNHSAERYASTIQRLIDWAWSDDDKSYLSEDSIYLSSKTMIWFLSSSNRSLRDSATKALVCLLKNHLSTLSKLLDDFKDVNDPYILERVLAVCYGVVLNTPIKEETQKIAQKVFDYFFKDGEPPIHLLTREYARGVCDFAISNKIEIIGKLDLVYPPYKSEWITPIPLEECIKKYKIENFVFDKASNNEIAQNTIVNSTSNSFYDFNKYEIGKSSDFSILRFNTKEEYNKYYKSLSNTKKRFLKLSKEYYNLTSKRIYDEKWSEIIKQAHSQIEESIQNILTKEEYDNYLNLAKPYFLHSSSSNRDDKFFDNDDFVSFIIEKIFALGWKKEIFGEFDGRFERNYNRSSKYENISEKYRWIAYYEGLARIADNFFHKERWGSEKKEEVLVGAWKIDIRDIDPTITLKPINVNYYKNHQSTWWFNLQYDNWNIPNWMKGTADIPDTNKLIQVKDNKELEWIMLQSFPHWKERGHLKDDPDRDKPEKEIWYHLRSYIIKKRDKTKFVDWAEKQRFYNNWMKETSESRQLFSKEHYWSNQYFSTMISAEKPVGLYKLSYNWRNQNCPFKGFVTTDGYRWGESKDGSLNEDFAYSILRPSYNLYNLLNLKQVSDYEFVDDSSEIVCIDPSLTTFGLSCLLVRKDKLLASLEKNDLDIVWTVLGEKLNLKMFGNSERRLCISGSCFLNDESKIENKLKFSWDY